MIDTLKQFTNDNLFSATSALLEKLHIQFDRETELEMSISDFWDGPMPKYLTEAMSYMDKTYFIGIVNDGSLQGQKAADSIEKVADIIKHDGKYDGIFVFACDAKADGTLTRSTLSALTRAFNRIASANPVILITRQGSMLNLSSCERMDYKLLYRQGSGEKLGKVSILRNINCKQPHRGHIDILQSLGDKPYTTFEELYKHWLETFSSELLTKKFYNELSDWYAWAVQIAKFPNDIRTDADDTKFNNESCIRLITRLIFVWFLKQKNLIPEEFFDEKYIREHFIEGFNPHDTDDLYYHPSESKYYRLILQNLFFAMLNCPIVAEGKDTPNNRRFRGDNQFGYKRDGYNINNLMRYKSEFKDCGSEEFLKIANHNVPFLNGGLFDCLDDKPRGLYYDGFSERMESLQQLSLPDYLFFGTEVGDGIDLSEWYGDKNKKKVSARGLIDILKKYSFTIEENTPLDQEVSLDPELLGKVFENLLAAFNPETQTSARKQTGSFYTPREIVQYMVDESLVAHLKRICGDADEQKYRDLVSYSTDDVVLSDDDSKNIMKALYNCRVLDPACGSGAFPMGVLQQMVHVLKRIDPTNEKWNSMMVDLAIEEARKELEKVASGNAAEKAKIEENRKARLDDIEQAFNKSINDPDYARKLYLIEHCIYGVDIQPIATQISKLRFFISLVVDQKPTTDAKNNFGIRPLPNLESKFVTANTLIPLDRTENLFTISDDVHFYEELLQDLNHRMFLAKRNKDKKELRLRMEDARTQMALVMEKNGFIGGKGYEQLTSWDMFDQNASASFFDPEWMFGVKDGFDIVIANPPYKIVASDDEFKPFYDTHYSVAHGGKRNLYHLFFEKAIKCMVTNGALSFITPDTYFSGNDTAALRQYLLNNVNIHSIVHYTEKDKVFENVTQAVAVITCNKKKQESNFLIFDHGETCTIELSNLTTPNKYVFKAYNSVINKLKSQKLTFDSVCEGFKGDVNLGIKRDYFTTIPNNNTLPLIRGIQISKYNYNPGNEYCSLDALSRNHTKMSRIVFQEVANMGLEHRVKGTILRNVILGDSTNYIYPTRNDIDLYYMLAVLNSKVVNYYFKYFNQTNHVPIGELKRIPFAIASTTTQETISDMVKAILNLDVNNSNRESLISNVDRYIYHLYNLTYDEVLVIDPSTPITREEYDNFKID